MDLAQTGLDLLQHLAGAMPDNPFIISALLFTVTTCAVSLCIPGLLMPIAFSAGLMLDGFWAVPIVTAGAVAGSQALFVAARCGAGKSLERRLSGRMEQYMPHLERYGLIYVAGLRVLGTPHALVTLASAASPLRHRGFALASMLGFLPAIAIGAGTGSVL